MAWWWDRCAAMAAGCRSFCAISSVLHVHGVAVDWEKVVGASASEAGRWSRCRPMRSSGSATGSRRPNRAETSRRWGSRRRSIRCWEQRRALAESDGFLLTGRLSLAEPGWLRDHAVFGTVLLPGTGLLELGFAAARAVGLTSVSQLTLVAPLVLPPEGAVRLQVQVDAAEAGEAGGRGLSIYSRLEAAAEGTPWTLHAQGVLGEGGGARSRRGGERARGVAARRWDIDRPDRIIIRSCRPADTTTVRRSRDFVEAWRVGDAVYGRVVLPEALSSSAEEYGLHPALLDAALHVLSFDRSLVAI